MKRPNKTTICMNNFFLDAETVAKIEKKRIGSPNIVGIKAVNEELEVEKYIIDQYVMNGGKILWLIDGVHAHIDSLKSSNSFMPDMDSGTIETGINIDFILTGILNCSVLCT